MTPKTLHPRTASFTSLHNAHQRTFHQQTTLDAYLQRVTSTTVPPETSLIPIRDFHPTTSWGNQLLPNISKPPDTLRIVLQNPNGISAKDHFDDLNNILQTMHTYSIDYIGLPETNLNFSKPSISQQVRHIIRGYYPRHRTIHSHTPLAFTSDHKPGGVLSILVNQWIGRVLSSTDDPSCLGRWTSMTLTGRTNRLVTIITAYQVCKNSINTCGITTAFSQQWHILRSQGNLEPSPRHSFISDLTKYILRLRAKEHSIILMGDFNDSLCDPTNALNQLCTNTSLSDPIRHQHGNFHGSTYIRGTTVLDYFLVSDDILPYIKRCGMLPYQSLVTSDHRAIFLDIDSVALFQGQPAIIHSRNLRNVSHRTPKEAKKFLFHTTEYWNRHTITNRINQLQSSLRTKPFHQHHKSTLERIDNDRVRAFLHGHNKCRTPEKPPWCPKLHRQSLIVRYWKIKISDCKNHRESTSTLASVIKQVQPPWTPAQITSLQSLRNVLRQARSKLRSIRVNARKYRDDYLTDRAAAAALAEDKDLQEIIRRIQKAEATHRSFSILRSALGKSISGGVTKVDIPSTTGGPPTTIEDRLPLETAILDRNHSHFGQAQGTPFTVPPLNQIPSSGCGPLADEILSGSIPIEFQNLGPSTLTLLRKLQRPSNYEDLPNEIKYEDWKQGFKVWNAETSTSPSGMYLDLYKSLTAPLGELEDSEQHLIAQGEQIFRDIFDITNISCKHGITLTRWHEVINCMIHKKSGSYLINKLRVIHLLEADFNLAIGILFGRYLVHSANDKGNLHNGQWGSRPGRSCEDVLLLKETTYTISRLSHTNLATFDNDAKSCYDRIVTSLALLIARHHGISEGACKMHANFYTKLIHRIKTAYGTSAEFYTHDASHPIHGVGQGTKDGPPLWLIVSSTLMACLDETATGLFVSDPSNTHTHQRSADGFVDDVTLFANQFLPNLGNQCTSAIQLAAIMQQDANLWQTFLHISGGKLELPKCLYYLMIWQWLPNGKAILSQATDMGNLIYLPEGETAVPINHYDCDTAHKTLGVWKAPSGNHTEQFKYLLHKSNQWACSVASAHLSPLETSAAYWQIWLPSICYGLSSCYLTWQQLDKIQAKAIQITLSKTGYNRNTSRIKVFGPSSLSGLGYRHIGTEQGIAQTLAFIKHLRSPGSLNEAITVALHWFLICAGLSCCPFSQPAIPLQFIDGSEWFNSIRSFLARCKCSLDIDYPRPPLEINRIHDRFLMDDIHSLSLSPDELVKIHRCRLYLQATTLSDITSPEGSHIILHAWQGTSRMDTSLLQWPRQSCPTTPSWTVWRSAISRLYLQPNHQYNYYSKSLCLSKPLGSWLAAHHTQQNHEYYYDPTTNQLLWRADDGFTCHPGITRSRFHRNFLKQPTAFSSRLPLHSYPITIIERPTVLQQPHIPSWMHDPTPTPETVLLPTTFSAYIPLLPLWVRSILADVDIHDEYSLIEYFRCQSIDFDFVSDGGCRNHAGSFGWCLGDPYDPLVTASGPAFGKDMFSFRAEAYGMLSMLLTCFHFCNFHSLPTNQLSFNLGCDNLGLIKRINYEIQLSYVIPNRSLKTDYDITSQIIELTFDLGSDFTFFHVPGHQNNDTHFDDLEPRPQLNVIADSLATEYLDRFPLPRPHVPKTATAAVHLLDRDGHAITHRLAHRLRFFSHDQPYLSNLASKNDWSPITLTSIHWPPLAAALSTFSASDQRRLRKWNNQILPTSRRMHRQYAHFSNHCPSCCQALETDEHLLQCSHPSRLALNTPFLLELTDLLHELQTEPSLAQTLLTAISFNLQPTASSTPTPNTDLCREQLAIGWFNIMHGYLTITWSHLQSEHYKVQDTDLRYFTGDLWARKITQRILQHLLHHWQQRNLDLYGPADQSTTALHQQAMHQVTQLYSQQLQVTHIDRSIFSQPLEEMEKRTTQALQNWLASAIPAVKEAIVHARALLQTNQSDIRSFFGNMPPNHNTSHPRTNHTDPSSTDTSSSAQSSKSSYSSSSTQSRNSSHYITFNPVGD